MTGGLDRNTGRGRLTSCRVRQLPPEGPSGGTVFQTSTPPSGWPTSTAPPVRSTYLMATVPTADGSASTSFVARGVCLRDEDGVTRRDGSADTVSVDRSALGAALDSE